MGRAPCCDKDNVKKGPWSPEEDAKLKSFIEKNGTGGNWIALPQKIGLKRCGKSCRLRWLNYLRPNIKHGRFTEDEDNLICSLYVSIGSRWSIIAAQLPGRTDNDIKNYWNTRLKKKLFGKQRREQQSVAAARRQLNVISYRNLLTKELFLNQTTKKESCPENNPTHDSNFSLYYRPPPPAPAPPPPLLSCSPSTYPLITNTMSEEKNGYNHAMQRPDNSSDNMESFDSLRYLMSAASEVSCPETQKQCKNSMVSLLNNSCLPLETDLSADGVTTNNFLGFDEMITYGNDLPHQLNGHDKFRNSSNYFSEAEMVNSGTTVSPESTSWVEDPDHINMGSEICPNYGFSSYYNYYEVCPKVGQVQEYYWTLLDDPSLGC